MTNENEKSEQSAYEKKRGLVARSALRENILGLFDELPEGEFHDLYHILWTYTAKNLNFKCASERAMKAENANGAV